mgnify:CR=1 FL=1
MGSEMCIRDRAGKPTFEINDDEIEIGMGIHGEPGISREKLKSANDLTDDICNRILTDFNLSDQEIGLMINSLGATPLEELYIVSRRVVENFNKKKIKIFKNYVGRYATSMEMAGLSITTLKLNNNLNDSSVNNYFASSSINKQPVCTRIRKSKWFLECNLSRSSNFR